MSEPTGKFVYVPLRTQLIQQVPWFFGPCFDHLEFLHRDHGFSYDGECLPFPDSDPLFFLMDDRLRIEILCPPPPRLPALTVMSLRARRRVLDLRLIVPEHALPGEDRYVRGHSLDGAAGPEGDRGFEAAVASRIAAFGAFLRENLNQLRRAA